MKSKKRISKKKIYILSEYNRAEGVTEDTGHFLNFRKAKMHVEKEIKNLSCSGYYLDSDNILYWETDSVVYGLREVKVTA